MVIIQENIQSKEHKSEDFHFLPNGIWQKINGNDSYFHDVDGPELSHLSKDCQGFGRVFDYYGDPINSIIPVKNRSSSARRKQQFPFLTAKMRKKVVNAKVNRMKWRRRQRFRNFFEHF